MSYVARYRLRLLLVVLCIILSAVASVLSFHVYRRIDRRLYLPAAFAG